MNNEYNLIRQRSDLYNQRAQNYFLTVEIANNDKPYFGREEISKITQKPAVFFETNSTIDNLVSNSGRGKFEMGAQWINEAKNYSAKYLALFKKSKTPTFLIQGTADPRYNYDLYTSFANDHCAKSLFIKGADHNFTEYTHRILLIDKVKDYFSQFLNK